MQYFNELNSEALRQVACRMMIAAKTAPKGRGIDNLVVALAERNDIVKIANKMKLMVEQNEAPAFFERDANNILQCEFMVLLGTKIQSIKIPQCGLCGFKDCDEKDKHPGHPCCFNTGDLGIAVGSAVSLASDCRVDNRILYSAGKAIKKMKILKDDPQIIYAIPISATGKSPFFDRK